MRKRRVVGRIYGLKYSRKGYKERNRHENRIKRSAKARLVYVKDIHRNIPYYLDTNQTTTTTTITKQPPQNPSVLR